MIKYTRKQINVKVSLHDKEFVTVEDAAEILRSIVEKSVELGADGEKLMEYLNNDG